VDEAADRLGIDRQTLLRAAYDESQEGWPDPEGNPLFHQGFRDNWAVGNMAADIDVNPMAPRFLAWLSFHAG
jgi:hypothetical protein